MNAIALNLIQLNKIQLSQWLALWRIPGIGPAKFFKLLQLFPNLDNLFPIDKPLLKHYGFKENLIAAMSCPDWQAVEKDLAWSEQKGCAIISWNDLLYPQLLRQIADAPPLLFIRGNQALLNQPQLAIVGSRNPTAAGLDSAYEFAAYLAQQGITITSGLALGIDAASHEGALSQPFGNTLAVMGTGADMIYPSRHKQLAANISEQGVIITELPLGIGVRPEHFPRRNRIISGLSVGVLVIEAALNSGSLITARLAAEQGREVFAIPGSVHNPLAKGCHKLIKQGAKLVETAADIWDELTGILQLFTPVRGSQPASTIKLEPEYASLLACVDYAATSVDNIIKRSRLAADKVSSMLLLLELDDYITAVPGGYLRL